MSHQNFVLTGCNIHATNVKPAFTDFALKTQVHRPRPRPQTYRHHIHKFSHFLYHLT